MKKNEILTKLEDERERFVDAIDGLSDEQMLEPGVVGEWSIKDILIHLSRWEAELVKLLWQVRQGQKPSTAHFSQTDVDDTNQEWYLEGQKRTLGLALDDFHAVRNQTALRIETFSDRDLEDPQRYKALKGKALWEWVAGDSFEHEAEHTAEIIAWRKQKGWQNAS